MKALYRKLFVFLFLGISLGIVAVVFYKIEIKYLTPTPIPEGYQMILVDSKVNVEEKLISLDRITFLHFYNPDCPCSRFNIEHVKSLMKNYKSSVDFLVVAQYNDDQTIDNIASQFSIDDNVQILIDKDKTVAKKMGVYSTPQAVILDKEGKLYYRGNYNKSRYCTDPGKFYAQQAIDSLLAKKKSPKFDTSATRSYGCSLYEEKDIIDKILTLK